MEPSWCTALASNRHRKQLQTPSLVAEGADKPEQEIPLPKAGSLFLKIRTCCKEIELPAYATICLTVAEVGGSLRHASSRRHFDGKRREFGKSSADALHRLPQHARFLHTCTHRGMRSCARSDSSHHFCLHLDQPHGASPKGLTRAHCQKVKG